MFTLSVYNILGKEIDTIKLNSSVFDGSENADCIHQAIEGYRSNQRKGLASTKTRGEVSGGGKKPWKQKGTGRARVGSTRSPLWRHGGVIFGPHPRDFGYTIPEKIKKLALKSALNARVKENNLLILDSLKIESAKTKDTAKIFSHLKIGTDKQVTVLLLVDKVEKNLKQAAGNISFLDVNLASGTHAYDILSHKKIIITKEALHKLVDRLKE